MNNMDNCYGQGDRIPRELLHNKNDRLTNKHIETLSFLQDIMNENKQLKQRIAELEKEQEQCAEIHAMAADSQERIKDLESNCLHRADEVNDMLAEQHRVEMMEVMDEKMEMERALKEEILKLRHEIESLKRTNAVLQEDSEWTKERDSVQTRIADLERQVGDLKTDVKNKQEERDTLQTSLHQSQAQTSELHQLQDLRTLNQSLADELKETNQKNMEFMYRIDKLQKQLRDESTEEEHTKLVNALQNKLHKLHKDQELAIMNETNLTYRCEEFRVLNSDLDKQIHVLEKECGKIGQEHQEMHLEYQRLSRRVHKDEDRTAFKEFLAVERELCALKEENEMLRTKINMSSQSLLPKDSQSAGAVRKPKGKKKLLSASLSSGTGSPVP